MQDKPIFSQRLDTYLPSLDYNRPKEVFKLIAEKIEAGGVPQSVLDVGCAAGQFLYYLKGRFSSATLMGIDTSPELLAAGRSESGLADVDLALGDALTWRGQPAEVTTCLGVLGVFNDPQPLIETLIANTVTGGRIFIHSHINDVDIDVRTSYRDNVNDKDWNGGFNIYSKNTIARCFGNRAKHISFHAVDMPFDMPFNPQQPHRAFTVVLQNGRRRTINGLCQMLPEHVVEVLL